MGWLTTFLTLVVLQGQVGTQDSLWKCHDPDRPPRFATSEESKDEQSPPCNGWIEMRAEKLAALLDLLAPSRFDAANMFLMQAGSVADFDYPGSDSGIPIPTSLLYEDPVRFGFEVSDAREAPTGSIVVYDGLGGILVEVRRSDEEPWSRQVLYPSEARQFELRVSDLAIPGKQPPKVLVPTGRF